MINLVAWLLLGGILGWIASLLVRTDGRVGRVLNVVVGIVGATLGGWALAPILGLGSVSLGSFNLNGLLLSLLGALLLLTIVNLAILGSPR